MNADTYPKRFGPYVLMKPLARGGMGALYMALSGEQGMEKLCVIKTVLPHLADRGYVKRFRDEAKVVVRLSHGNLVTVFDAGQAAGELYLAMDFVEGRDLRAVWNRCAQKGIAFPVDVAVHIVKELVRGLGYAHSFDGLALVHRDVSPPNVLLSYTGEVKLTDFGLASSTLKREKTAPGVIYGKVSYMAPEQARGEPLDGRADLYAAGIILWELLTGRQLFPAVPGGGDDAVLEKVRHPIITPPSKKTGRVPPELERIVLKALAPDRAERYQNGEELRADLAAFQAKTAPATDGEHVARFLRELFDEAIARERVERQALMSNGAKLLPVPASSSSSALRQIRDGDEETTAVAMKRPADGTKSMLSPAPAQALREGPSSSPTSVNPGEAPSRMVGGVLAGRYRILRLCGEGGMGRVYEAEHTEIGKHVAIKVLHPAYTRTPDVVERFRREARAASKIGHPNIVNVTDSGTTADGSFFFVMEYIEGIELGLLIHREGPLPIARALGIAEQMCNALQAAHDAGVIHRDLKPENVLLVGQQVTPERTTSRPDFVKVLDFGIAKSTEVEESAKVGRRLTRPGVAMGTPEYMAPEQAAGKPADPRSDIYAVGSIMYEMLSGVPPYEGDNVMEVLHKKANEPPRPLLLLRPDLRADVAALVERAMARNPAERPQSMAALAEELRALMAALTSPLPVVTPAGMPSMRRDSGLLAGSIEPAAGLTTLGLPKRVVAIAAVALGALTLFVVVRAATRPSRPIATAAPAPAPAPPAPAPTEVTPPPTPAPTPPEAPPAPAEAVAAAEQADEAPAEEPTPASPSPAAPRRASRAAKPPALSADDARKLLADGQRLLKEQRFAEARLAFTRLLDAKRTKGPALVGLGEVAFQQRDYPEALRRAKQGLGAGGGASAQVLLGDAYFKLEKYPDAVKAYNEALKLDPGNSVAQKNLDAAKRRLD
jgi:serine/threonine protein kinase